MARKIRLEYAGAVYHVMARGNQGRRIYRDDSDRKLWLEVENENREGGPQECRVLIMTLIQNSGLDPFCGRMFSPTLQTD